MVAKKKSTHVDAPVVNVEEPLHPGVTALLHHGDNIESFLSLCAHLPEEIEQDLMRLGQMDAESHRLMAEIRHDQLDLLESAKADFRQATHPDQLEGLIHEGLLKGVREKRRKVEDLMSDKVSLSVGTYDRLDGSINRL
ncbi:unnamed protein product, partial [Discosporangium mesarthrocarpum]